MSHKMPSKKMSPQFPVQNSKKGGFREYFLIQNRLGGTACPSTPVEDTTTVAIPPLATYEGINPSPVSQKQHLLPPASIPRECGERKGDHLGHRCVT